MFAEFGAVGGNVLVMTSHPYYFIKHEALKNTFCTAINEQFEKGFIKDL